MRVILSTPMSLGLTPWLVPSLAALAGYLLAMRPGERPWRVRLLPLAWLAHGLAGVLHLFGIGEPGQGVRFGFAPVQTRILSAFRIVPFFAPSTISTIPGAGIDALPTT